MSIAMLPTGELTKNFSIAWDSLDVTGPGWLQWNEPHPEGIVCHSFHFTQAIENGGIIRCEFDGKTEDHILYASEMRPI